MVRQVFFIPTSLDYSVGKTEANYHCISQYQYTFAQLKLCTVVPLLKDPSHKRLPPVTDHYYLARMHLPYILKNLPWKTTPFQRPNYVGFEGGLSIEGLLYIHIKSLYIPIIYSTMMERILAISILYKALLCFVIQDL